MVDGPSFAGNYSSVSYDSLSHSVSVSSSFSAGPYTLSANSFPVAPGGSVNVEGGASGFTYIGTLSNGDVLLNFPGFGYFLFSSSSARSGSYAVNTGASLACFARGTAIATAAGPVAVERLRLGDQVLLAGGGSAPIRWIGQARVELAGHPHPQEAMPVRVQAGALAPGVPARDLLLSPDHALYLDSHLIPVRYLCNGASIDRLEMAAVTYFHVELPRHAVLLAEGAPAESYLDTGNRACFADAGGTLLQHPDHVAQALAIWESQACAPLLTAGPVLDGVRARLEARAAALGWGRSEDPQLQLEIDGASVPMRRAGEHWIARLPQGATGAVLRSRHFVPAELGLSRADGRRLGVALTGLWLDGAAAALDGATLAAHWHAPEAGLRWSDGAGELVLQGQSELTLRLAPLPAYRQAPARAA